MDILSTSSITSLVNSYKQNEVNRRLASINSRKNKISNLSKVLSELSGKVSNFVSLLSDLKSTSSTSVFNTKKANTTNDKYVTATALSSADIGNFDIFVNQLAKNDMAVSKDLASDVSNTLSGAHTFLIKTGKEGGEYYSSKVTVELTAGDTNKSFMEKVRDAINSDTASVDSNYFTGSDIYAGGSTSITFDISGTTYTVDALGGGTYEELLDELVSNINSNVTGVTAQKIEDTDNPGSYKLNIAANNYKDSISISHSSQYDLVSELGIAADNEISASSKVTASVYTPLSGKHQFSLTSKNSGLDYRITELSDLTGSSVLNSLGLNLGTSRPAFDQNTDPDTSGFLYADITNANNQLNAKFLFNGITVQKNSNTVSDLVEGINFELKSVMTDGENNVNISVENDSSAVRSKFEKFIESFNSLYTYLKEKTKSVDGNRGILRGEANASSLLSSLNKIGLGAFGSTSDDIRSLTNLGIKFDSSSGLSISDSDQLNEQLDFNISDVEKLFNSTEGIAASMYDSFNLFVGTNGYLTSSKNQYDNSVNYLDQRIDTISSSIDKSSELLRKRYQQMQIQLATLMSAQSMFYSQTY